jgi:hypothetical protein
LATSERIDWRLSDVLEEDAALDFSRPFLPALMTGVSELPFLTDSAKLTLGQIRAHGYLALFGVVEEMILPFVLDQTRREPLGELEPTRALLRFAAEEAKHIELFRRFGRVFARQFPVECRVAGSGPAFAQAVLAYPELSVGLAILHIEWMTQQHWLDCVRGDESLEPAFKRLLRFHWLEEAQHARLDAMLVSRLARAASASERSAAVDGYLAILELIDGGIEQQIELDRQALEQVSGLVLSLEQLVTLRRTQKRSRRRTFLLSGMAHPRLVESLNEVSPAGAARVAARARDFA